jgi:predicted permease
LKAEVNIGSFGAWLLYKLILTPAIIYLLYVVILNQNSKMIEVAIMESAMAPMITASILATTHGLKPRLSSMMIGFGILFLYHISFLVLYVSFSLIFYPVMNTISTIDSKSDNAALAQNSLFGCFLSLLPI